MNTTPQLPPLPFFLDYDSSKFLAKQLAQGFKMRGTLPPHDSGSAIGPDTFVSDLAIAVNNVDLTAYMAADLLTLLLPFFEDEEPHLVSSLNALIDFLNDLAHTRDSPAPLIYNPNE